MNNFKIFNTKTEYDDFIKTEYPKPNISLIKEGGILIFTDAIKKTLSKKESIVDLVNGEFNGTILPEGITKLPSNFFYDDKNIREIVCPSTLKSIGIYCFGECTNLSKVTFNEGLEEIGDGAISFDDMENVTIPSTVKKLGRYLFPVKTAKSLRYVKFLGTTPPQMNSETFAGGTCYNKFCRKYPIFVPDEAVDAYKEKTLNSIETKRIKPLSTFNEEDYK